MSARTRAGYFEANRPRVEVIPMIDIMMFLLVFFVVISLRMIAGTGLPMEIPSSKTTQSITSSTVTVGIAKTGEMVIDGKVVTEEELKTRLVELKKQKPLDIVLAGDKDVPLQSLLQVMDAIRGAGISSVGIAAKADKK